MCASGVAFLMLPAVAAAQMIVIRDAGALRGGGGQLVLRGDGAQGGAPWLGGAALAMLQGVGISVSAALRGGQAGVLLEHTEKMWMPAGGGAVQRQNVKEEEEEEDQVSSDGRRQVRRVTCMDGRCEDSLASGPALAPLLGSAAEAGKQFVDHLKAAAKKASKAPCDEDEARQFLEAVRDEYVHGVHQDVGRYIDKEGGPSSVTGRDEYVKGAVQDKLDPFEDRVRQARLTRGKAAASREVDAIAEEWGLWLPPALAAPSSVATRVGAPAAAKPFELGDDAAERADYAAGRVRAKAWMEDDRLAEAKTEDDDDDSDGADDDDDGLEIVYDFVPDSAADDDVADGPDGPEGPDS